MIFLGRPNFSVNTIFPFYEVQGVFLLRVLSFLPMRPIPLIWWHHLDSNLVSRSCWNFWLSLDIFRPQGPFFLNRILVSAHAPQFWDKMILFQNYFLWPLHVSYSQPPALIFIVSNPLTVVVGSSLSFSLIFWAILFSLQLMLHSWPFDILVDTLFHCAQRLLPLPTAVPVTDSLDWLPFLLRSRAWSISKFSF